MQLFLRVGAVTVAGGRAEHTLQLWSCQGDDPAQHGRRGHSTSLVDAASARCLDLARATTTIGARTHR